MIKTPGRRECPTARRFRCIDLPAVTAVKDGRVFPFAGSVVTPRADRTVSGHRGQDLVDLEPESLLQPHEVGIGLAQDIEDQITPVIPGILAVRGGSITDVEAHDGDGDAGSGNRRSGKQGQAKDPRVHPTQHIQSSRANKPWNSATCWLQGRSCSD
jgi:hypothetical protein